MKHTLAILFVLCSLCTSSIAQDVTAKIEIDRENALIGEQIEVILSLTSPVTTQIDFTEIGDTLTKSIEVVIKEKIDTNYSGSNLSTRILVQKLLVTSFDSGYHTIPPIIFNHDGEEVKTEPMLVSFTSVPVEMTEATQQGELEIKDIKTIRDVDFSLWAWFKSNYIWFVLGLGLIVAIWAYFKYIHPKLKKKGPAALIPKKVSPPHEIALDHLNKLDDKKLWQSGSVKLYHSELTEIIRTYIEDRYNVPALESTTEEIMTDLKGLIAEDQVAEKLRGMLSLADLVKFAKHSPLPDENTGNMEVARQFVIATKPIPQAEPNEEETVEHV